MSEALVAIILSALQQALLEAAKKYITWYIRKRFDDAGRIITEIYHKIDTDGDGVGDTDEVLFTLDTFLPDLGEGFTLVNNGNEIGIGLPSYRLVDSSDVVSALEESESYTSNGDYILIDLDRDGEVDDFIHPLIYDGNGDGLPDFEVVVDDDNNGLPDLSPESFFYPVGSEGYQQFIETHSDNVPALDKSFKNFTVTEALLFLIAFCAGIGVISKIIRRRKL